MIIHTSLLLIVFFEYLWCQKLPQLQGLLTLRPYHKVKIGKIQMSQTPATLRSYQKVTNKGSRYSIFRSAGNWPTVLIYFRHESLPFRPPSPSSPDWASKLTRAISTLRYDHWCHSSHTVSWQAQTQCLDFFWQSFGWKRWRMPRHIVDVGAAVSQFPDQTAFHIHQGLLSFKSEYIWIHLSTI